VSTESYSISGDWTEIASGLRVRLKDAPNEEDMQEHYRETSPVKTGIVILEVERSPYPEPGVRQHGDDVDEVQDDVPIHRERLIR
jgi:hypothetical protein